MRLDLEGQHAVAALFTTENSRTWTRFQRTSFPADRGPSPGMFARTLASIGPASETARIAQSN
jgi:hypothetical protein